MLGARTKQLNTYGRRNQRVVTISDDFPLRQPRSVDIFADLPPTQWGPVVSKMRKKVASPRAKTGSPKVIHISKKRQSPFRHPPQPAVEKRAARADLLRKRSILNSAKHSAAFRDEPPRAPLSPCSTNVINSHGTPAPSPKPKPRARVPSALATHAALMKPRASLVDVEIVVFGHDGRTISKERRVSRSDPAGSSIPNPRQTARVTPKDIKSIVDSEDDTELSVIAPRKRRSRRTKMVRILSDEEGMSPEKPITITSDCDVGFSPQKPISVSSTDSLDSPIARRGMKVQLPGSQRPLTSYQSQIEIVMPTPPYSLNTRKFPPPSLSPLQVLTRADSPIARTRLLTPIRSKIRKGMFYVPPSPPSPTTPTDLDFSFDLSGTNLSEELGLGPLTVNPLSVPSFPSYLLPLLTECHQEDCGPYEFSAFIEAFPHDQSVRAPDGDGERLQFKKIGEASFSEVFGIGDVVLKIIPLYDGESDASIGHEGPPDIVDAPAPSSASDVLREVIVTRAMSEVSDGFVKILKAYVVRGRYPEVLLDLWDEYFEHKGSEGIRPDTFLVQQTYAIIVLANGGIDLEAYTFSNSSKTGWRQACSLFWQVAKTLAHAEQLVSFEHRDLHWGQILVKNTTMVTKTRPLGTQDINQGSKTAPVLRPMMDAACHGVQATIIDLGLSRMDAGDGQGGEMVHWTPFDEMIFTGEGDYQFDVYRLMRAHNGDSWEEFKPLTNVMWLHYLILKLLRAKHLKAPRSPRKSVLTDAATATPARSAARARTTSTTFTERECYEALVELERLLQHTIARAKEQSKARTKQTNSRRKTGALAKKSVKDGTMSTNDPKVTDPTVPYISCAGAVVEFGVKRRWILPVR